VFAQRGVGSVVAELGCMCGFPQLACVQVVCDRHGFMRNLRDGFYRLDEPTGDPRIPQAP